MSGKPIWESIKTEKAGAFSTYLDRIPVPGGWIYRTMLSDADTRAVQVSTTFVPFARFSGADMEGRLATSPHSPANAPRPASEIPDFSAPAPKRRS